MPGQDDSDAALSRTGHPQLDHPQLDQQLDHPQLDGDLEGHQA
ncbi:hypothetical protein [Streptomyces sp. NPDC051776]